MKEKNEKDLVKQELLEVEKKEKESRNKIPYKLIIPVLAFCLLCNALAVKLAIDEHLEKKQKQEELWNMYINAASTVEYTEYVEPEYNLPEGYIMATVNDELVGVKIDAIIELNCTVPKGYVLTNIDGKLIGIKKTITIDDEKKLSLSK